MKSGKAWQYIMPLSLMQYGGGRHIADLRELREDKTLQKASGLKNIPSDSAAGDWLLRNGKRDGNERLEKAHMEATIKILKADKDTSVKEAIKRISEEQWRPCHNIHARRQTGK